MFKSVIGSGNPKHFHAYIKTDLDLESGNTKKFRKPKRPALFWSGMFKSMGDDLRRHYKLHPLPFFLFSLSFGFSVFVVLSLYRNPPRFPSTYPRMDIAGGDYPFSKLKNLVMVAGHSVYSSSNCAAVDNENSWFLESYQKNPGQAATFLSHIQKGVEDTARDDGALLLFSGGETRKDAGPRSEAQSYWLVADSKGWFQKEESVRWRAMTEEHARDSFENLLFSICRFRELTGQYPENVTVVGYDFKRERFSHLHRAAVKFPKSRFFYSGTPSSSASKMAAMKGEALVRAQFMGDPYGCLGPLYRKKRRRDPFHRSIPYPLGCPEIQGLFKYCGTTEFPGFLPWLS